MPDGEWQRLPAEGTGEGTAWREPRSRRELAGELGQAEVAVGAAKRATEGEKAMKMPVIRYTLPALLQAGCQNDNSTITRIQIMLIRTMIP